MKLAFAMIDMPHWREARDQGATFERLYDALYGYSFCFDPYLLNALKEVPCLVEKKKLLAQLPEFDALVSPQRETTEALQPRWPRNKPALWVDPPPALAAPLCKTPSPVRVNSLREKLTFADETSPAFLLAGHHLLKFGFWPFEPEGRDIVVGHVGERPIWLIRGCAGYGSINHLFSLSHLTFSTATIAAFVTAFVRALCATLKLPVESAPPVSEKTDNLRRDFHAFGACLALLEFGLREGGFDSRELTGFHAPLLRAARSAVDGDESKSRPQLKEAFRVLETVRQKHLPFQRGCIDIPHAGILGPDGGLAEMEWPELSKNYLAYMADMAETFGYRFSLEYNVGSLVEMARRYPEIIQRLGRLWRENRIDLVNGSWSGPLQQYTNIELAAREFELGQAGMEQLFGRRCETYVCQESSFLPSFPGLLRDFGYKRAAHVTSNRGQAPESRHNHFCWQGKDGRRISALGHHELDLTVRGNNWYIEWPTTAIGCLRRGIERLDCVLLQDQGRIPFREEMIRTECYAPVLGRHVTIRDVLPEGPDANLPVESFPFDRYTFESAVHDPISYDWISMVERVLGYAHRVTRAEMLAATTATHVNADFKPIWEWLLYLESHDNLLCPKGTSGDFYGLSTLEYSGPHFDVHSAYFGKLLANHAPTIEALLLQIEDQALKRLGLQRLNRATPPRNVVLYNPYPQPLELGGWFPWQGDNFMAAGDAVRMHGWNGRCYWSGHLSASAGTRLKTAATRKRNWSGRQAQPGPGWRFRKGTNQTLAMTPSSKDRLSWSVIPMDGKQSKFQLTGLMHTGDPDFAVTRARWSDKVSGEEATIVQVDFVQIQGCPLVFAHAEVEGYNPGELPKGKDALSIPTHSIAVGPQGPRGWHKENDALRLRFIPGGALQAVRFFVSHFTEVSRKEHQTSSPYVALAETAKGTLALLNRGGIWHRHHGHSLEYVLMAPHETVNRRDFALAWNLDHPVTSAIQQLDQPILAVAATSANGGNPLTVRSRRNNLWISSLRPDGQMRISETEGLGADVELTVSPAPVAVQFSGERGRKNEKPELTSDGRIRFHLAPYESAAISIERRA
ncbi:MAG: hypothetical protein HY360_14995 [Verrucomicrobia bacterium]|nr:hypothetical protein [Verrucomicrobiota bacterium]